MYKKVGFKDILKKYLPENEIIVNYCYDLWTQYPFKLKITPSRETKKGDYTFNIHKAIHIITLNNDLNKYDFVITYIHEIAHLIVRVKYGNKVAHHGQEWKSVFVELLNPIVLNHLLPTDLEFALVNYMKNPKAGAGSDQQLMIELQKFDLDSIDKFVLSDLPIGTQFIYRNRVFKKGKTIRTRTNCLEINSNKIFLVNSSVFVEICQISE